MQPPLPSFAQRESGQSESALLVFDSSIEFQQPLRGPSKHQQKFAIRHGYFETSQNPSVNYIPPSQKPLPHSERSCARKLLSPLSRSGRVAGGGSFLQTVK